jgi:hypothetical protein
MFGSGVGVIDMAGQSDLRLRASVDDVGGIFAPRNQCQELDCVPGTQVNLEGFWTGLDLRGTLRWKGKDYVLGTEQASGVLGIARFDGTLTLPPFSSAATVIDIDAPFSFSGEVRFQDTFTVEPLSGSGVATLQFRQSSDGTAWQFVNATYAFQHASGGTQ